jgi:hypothetical protein
MPTDDFDKLMDHWADQETRSAPEQSPPADMYRMVKARKRRIPIPFLSPRRSIAGLVLACLVLLAISYVVIYRPSFLFGSSSEQVIAFVQQRQGVTSGDGIIFLEPEQPGKEPRAAVNCFQKLIFQFYLPASRFVEAIDLRFPNTEPLSLASEDNYRLTIEPAETCYVYIYQVNAARTLSRLFPDPAYSSIQNPPPPGEITILPSEPSWFYLQGEKGEQHLYIIASLKPVPDLENLYTQTIRVDEGSEKQEALSIFLKYLDTLATSHPGEVQRVEFTFQFR